MKYYIIAGEASGDLHGSNLIKELKKIDPQAEIRCWGGDMMQASGGVLVKHYKDLAFMGFTEVVKNLGTIFKNLRFCKSDIIDFRPDAVILIDYPGFNLRIASWAHQHQYKVIYYISPQVWAWKESRVKAIRKTVGKMIVILPFEQDFYKKWDYEVEYVGHPLVEVIENFKKEAALLGRAMPGGDRAGKVIALLPGSRKQEILKKLPIMLSLSTKFPGFHFVVAQAPGQEDAFYTELLRDYKNVSSVKNDTYNLLLKADAALVTSGTATLETALFGVPEVICYRGSTVSYWIAKRLIKVKYICLVNLIMNKEVVKELIQDELNVENLQKELHLILYDTKKKIRLQQDYADLKNLLSQGGNASANAARAIMQYLQT
jgi:lipid-A-disaccharide synthase